MSNNTNSLQVHNLLDFGRALSRQAWCKGVMLGDPFGPGPFSSEVLDSIVIGAEA